MIFQKSIRIPSRQTSGHFGPYLSMIVLQYSCATDDRDGIKIFNSENRQILKIRRDVKIFKSVGFNAVQC